MSTVVSAEQLLRFCREAFQRVGVPEDDAAIMAFTLVEADLKGIETHGTGKLPGYLDLLRKSELNPRAEIKITRSTPTTAVIDGDRCASGLAAYKAMKLAVEKAKTSSIGVVTVRNVGRCGALSTFASLALEQNMIGFMTAQGAHVVAPYGGRTKQLNTSPWSFAIPAGRELPIVLDMSSTEAANSKISLAAKEKRKIPFGWLLDRHGRPTDDPNELAHGFQTWIGGPKGYGLAVIDQVLAGLLGSAPFLGQQRPQEDDAFHRGHFAMALKVEAFMELDDFCEAVDALIQRLKSSDRIDGVDTILMPGERSLKTRARRIAEGIPIRPVIWKELTALAAEMQLELTAG